MTASYALALSDTQVMITRCVRRSLRDPEAFFTALMLPVVLMLLFVYIFGGAINTGHGGYADYVVPASSCCAPASAPARPRSPSPPT